MEKKNLTEEEIGVERLNEAKDIVNKIFEVEFRDRIKGIYFNDKRNYQQTHSYIGLEIVDLCSYPINKYIKLSKKDEAFLIIENKLDKGIEKAIKRFP